MSSPPSTAHTHGYSTVIAHTHTFTTASGGSHTHTLNGDASGNLNVGTDFIGIASSAGSRADASVAEKYGNTVQSGGAHTHAGPTDSTGSASGTTASGSPTAFAPLYVDVIIAHR